jgi:uncharacterized phiE125 gp8 family phage protein
VTPPTIEPVTLELARAQCRASSAEDALLAVYIRSAREAVEKRLQRSLLRQRWQLDLDGFPRGGDIRLWWGPILLVQSITYTAPDGSPATLAAEGYVLDAQSLPGWILPAVGQEWPETLDGAAGSVRVQFWAGYGETADLVPAPIVTWILGTVGALYEQRASVDSSGRVKELPERFFDALIDQYRVPSF